MLGVINSFLVFFEVADVLTTLPPLIVMEVCLRTVLVVVFFMVDSICDCFSCFLVDG